MDNILTSISSIIEDYNLRFCEEISKKYGLNKEELIELWKNISDGIEGKSKASKSVKQDVKNDVKNEDKKEVKSIKQDVKDEGKDEVKNESKIDEKILAKSTKPQLAALCKERGLKVSGNKEELITRLLNFSISESKGESKDGKSKGKVESKIESKIENKKSEVKSKVREAKEEQLLKKFAEQQTNTLEIRRNVFNNYEHPITKLLFRKEDKKVYGKQNDDGTVSDLTKEDIEECKKYKFDYELPLNLNKKVSLKDVKVEEIEEEEEVEIEEEEEELVEEELVEEYEEYEEEVEEEYE
jgi:hypothetical protein